MAFSILIADDSSTVRSMVARTLTVAGVPLGKVFAVSDGSEALSVLGQNWVDLVLLDINMPRKDGMEVVEAMTADDILKTIPVVVISSDVSPAKIARLKRAGVKAFINKPFTPESVRDTIKATLGGWSNAGVSPDAL